MFGFRERDKTQDALVKATKRDIFYYSLHGKAIELDPLITYVKLKEIGFDVFGQRLKGVLRGEVHQTSEFMIAMNKVFGINDYDTDKEHGFTVLEASDLYIKFFLFVKYLKKNYTLMAGFAPSMEQEWQVLQNVRSELLQESEENAVSSDSQNASKPQQQSQDSAPTTEQTEPSAD